VVVCQGKPIQALDAYVSLATTTARYTVCTTSVLLRNPWRREHARRRVFGRMILKSRW